MTEETRLIWERAKDYPAGATFAEMVAWTGRLPRQASLTIGLMIQAGQLRRLSRNHMGNAIYVRGEYSTFGLKERPWEK